MFHLQTSRKNFEDELRARLARLEDLVKSSNIVNHPFATAEIDPAASGQVTGSGAAMTGPSSDLVNGFDGVPPHRLAQFTPSSGDARDVSHWMGSTLWVQLSDEVCEKSFDKREEEY
ncbi:hypothetical protein LTR28_004329 [Elasticomyces elasticus]|nr:hypothetical protein LTR28_004329 [Elasticomyces elasticus]